MVPSARRPRWEALPRDLLVSIFQRVGVDDLVAGVPLVCSAWSDATRDPRCWKYLDFCWWDPIARRLQCRRDPPVDFKGLLRFAVGRARGAVASICFPWFADELNLLYIAESCPVLHYFSLHNDDIPIDQFCKAVDKLKCLEGMAVHENLICEEVLQYVKQSCVNFSDLEAIAEYVDENMAATICNSLPQIRKLKLKYYVLSQQAILLFLDKLKDLEHLDIYGYHTPEITDVVLQKASRLKLFLWDLEFDEDDFYHCSDCGMIDPTGTIVCACMVEEFQDD